MNTLEKYREMQEDKQQPQKQVTTLLIEKVNNGFIVKEDYDVDRRAYPQASSSTKVFESKKALTNFINQSF